MATLDSASSAPKEKSSLASLIERENKRRQRKHRMWWGMLALAIVLAAAGWYFLRPRPVPFAARFRVTHLAQGDLTRLVRATGNVDAVTTVKVGAEISGRIATVEVDYNSRVKAGQVLARFDRTSLLAQLAQAAATLAAARSSLAQAITDRDRTARDLARDEVIYAQKSLSQAEYDNAVSAARLAEQRVTAAQAELQAQLAMNKVAQTNLDHSIVFAPIDGVVITRNIDPGQTVASAFQTPVLFTVAADLRKMQVVASTDEADIGELKESQHATFTVNAYPDRVFNGIVTQVRNSPEIVQDVVTYGTVIEVDNEDLALKPGMTASVHIVTDSAKNVFYVPNTALNFTPADEKKYDKPCVWVIDGSTLRRVEVKTGMSDGESTVIALGALSADANVVTELSPEGKLFYVKSN